MARRRYTEQQFRAALADPGVRTMADLCRALELVPRGANYETLRRYADACGIDLQPYLRPPPRSRRNADVADAELAAAIATTETIAAALRAVDLNRSETNYRWVHWMVERLELDTSHWTGQGWARGLQRPELRRSLEPILRRGTRVKGSKLRQRLIATGMKAHRCESCGRTDWSDGPIPLELDHIDGDRTNNELSNLRLLCPDCHALTPTYRGRNIGRSSGPDGVDHA